MLVARLWSSKLLIALLNLLSVCLAVPDLGIQRDWIHPSRLPSEAVTSYSGIIHFTDPTIPGDKSKLSDAQFVNLAKVAYDRMVAIWQGYQISSTWCPGAMIAMESGGSIYFASSLRFAGQVDIDSVDQDVVNSVGWYLKQCYDEGMGTHRTGGACAEVT